MSMGVFPTRYESEGVAVGSILGAMVIDMNKNAIVLAGGSSGPFCGDGEVRFQSVGHDEGRYSHL